MLNRPMGACRRQQGLSLVELMVGVAVGLFVVAGAAFVSATQLGDNRALLLETQLQQDLRATMDIITREIRRSGSTAAPLDYLWGEGGAGVDRNPFSPITVSAAGDSIAFSYQRGPNNSTAWGFKLENERIKSLIGGNWQELTDINVMRITGFTVTPTVVSATQIPCPRECAGGGTACWPTLVVRDYVVNLSVQSKTDANVRRSLRNQVRVRNDWLRFNDPANPDQVCPL